jgi:hypothetical protein
MLAKRFALTSFLFTASMCALGVGCSAPVGAATSPGTAEASPEAVSASSSAVVLIERTVSSGESARAEAVARFLRMRSGAVDDDALRMVGAAIDFPTVGACAPLSAAKAPEDSAARVEPRAVELVDVGFVSVEVNGVGLSLPPRRLPDIVDLVSGVVYSTRASDPEALPSDATYVVRASGHFGLGGDSDLGPFVASAIAPVALGETEALLVGGQDVKAPGGVALTSDAPVELAWRGGNPEDVVYVDVTALPQTAATSIPTRGVRCMFSDAGRAVLSPAAFADGDTGTLSIHRLHREAFQARGIDTGEIRFDFARVVAWSTSPQAGAPSRR